MVRAKYKLTIGRVKKNICHGFVQKREFVAEFSKTHQRTSSDPRWLKYAPLNFYNIGFNISFL
jgi:hypothetical protein